MSSSPAGSTSSYLDPEYLSMLFKYQQQNYYQLKNECLSKGAMFEDDLFPADDTSYYLKATLDAGIQVTKVDWMRPHQILSESNEVNRPTKPVFINKLSLTAAASGSFSSPYTPTRNASSTTKSISNTFPNQFLFVTNRKGRPAFVNSLTILFVNGNFYRVVLSDQVFDCEYVGKGTMIR